MNIQIDYDKLLHIQSNIEGDDFYTISMLFDDGQVCTYGYSNQKDFLKDYTKIKCERNE